MAGKRMYIVGKKVLAEPDFSETFYYSSKGMATEIFEVLCTVSRGDETITLMKQDEAGNIAKIIKTETILKEDRA